MHKSAIIDFKDLINALFELGGAIMAWLNVVKLRKDKAVSGVFWPTTLFFATWGFWNVIYYPALNQPLSAVAGAFLALANAVWVVLADYHGGMGRDEVCKKHGISKRTFYVILERN